MQKFVMKGNGKTIHILKEFKDIYGYVYMIQAKCDGFNGFNLKNSLRYVEATEATCKRCLK